MNSNEFVRNMCADLTGSNRVVNIPMQLVELTGDLNSAAVLTKCIEETERHNGYFAKTYMEWKNELHLSKYQVSEIMKKFKKVKIISTTLKQIDGAPTLHYRVNAEMLFDFIKNGGFNYVLR